MKISAEQEIAGIMAAAIGRLQKHPTALGPNGWGTTEERPDGDAGRPETDPSGQHQKQTRPQEEQA